MKKKLKRLKELLDILWVIQAFVRGTVLGQKEYCLQTGIPPHLPVPANMNRILMLMQLWGYQPTTIKEVATLIEIASESMGRNDFNYLNPLIYLDKKNSHPKFKS